MLRRTDTLNQNRSDKGLLISFCNRVRGIKSWWLGREREKLLFSRKFSSIGNVTFTTDPFNSHYLGDTSVSPQAALEPNLKGYGTLADLRVAMTLDPILVEWDPADRVQGGAPDVSRGQHPFPWRNSRTGRTIGYGQGLSVSCTSPVLQRNTPKPWGPSRRGGKCRTSGWGTVASYYPGLLNF